MKYISLIAVVALAATPAAFAAQTSAPEEAAACAPEGDVQFICLDGPPEDLVPVPGTDWILASSFSGKGTLSVVNTRDRSVTKIYPAANAKDSLDKKTYDACPGPLEGDEKAEFETHGLAVRAGSGGKHKVYVVHHGGRESIEVFDLDASGKVPSATWIGCVVSTPPVWMNSIIPLPDGGFIASNFSSRNTALTGENNGELWIWHSGKGLSKIPGTEMSGANGLELSKDGKILYVNAWGSQSVYRMTLGANPPKRESIDVGFRIDNLHWAPDGMLLGGGQTPEGTRIVKIDPNTLKVTQLLDHTDTKMWGHGTVAAQVGDKLWLGTSRIPKIAIFPMPK